MTLRTRAVHNATTATPASFTADLEGAEEVTVKVRCGHPEGVVILTGARLTRS